MSYNLLFFTMGFLIDKISLFPFFLGLFSGCILFSNNEIINNLIKKFNDYYTTNIKSELEEKINFIKKNKKKTMKNK